MLLQYRLSHITVDIDTHSPYLLHNTLDKLVELKTKKIEVFRTERGYHIRAPLKNPFSSFDDLLVFRDRTDDDSMRLRIDRVYLKAGYPFLTNLLFNEKAWWRDGKLESYKEEPIDPNKEFATHSVTKFYPLPPFSAEILGGRVWTEGDKIKAEGPFSDSKFKEIVEMLESLPTFKEAKEKAELKQKLKDAYCDINPALKLVVEKCEITKANGVIQIKVPSTFTRYVGRLIGKEGCNVRTVSTKLNAKIKIISEGQMPEYVDMKQKLKRLLGEVI